MTKRKRKRDGPPTAVPDVPAQQTNPSPRRPSAWARLLILLTSTSLQGLATWLGVLLTATIFAASYYLSKSKEREAAEQSLSRISYAWFIKPAPAPGEQFEKTGRWEVSIMVANSGPVTAETVVLHLYTPPPSVFLHSAPTVMSSAAAARVEIVERIPEGVYQVVYTHLTSGDGAVVRMFYKVPEEKKETFMRAWHDGGMFKGEFARNFINQFFFTGDHLKVSNFGGMDFEPAFKSTEKFIANPWRRTLWSSTSFPRISRSDPPSHSMASLRSLRLDPRKKFTEQNY